MSQQDYDLTYQDLNPTFLYLCSLRRTDTETNYHCHEHIEISILTKGYGTYYIEGKEYPLAAGDLVILNPGIYHKSLVTCPDLCAMEYYIGFTDIHIRNTVPNTFPLPGGHLVLHMKDMMKQEVFKLCTTMEKEFETCRPGRYFMLKAYLIQLILVLLRDQQELPMEYEGCIFESPNKKHVVNQMIRYFTEHYQEKISLDQIAKNMYLSTFYLSKIFKSETGDTPINYLISLRMEKASELMMTMPGISIQSVASMVGYDDAYHFSKLFKKRYGVSPSQVKK